MELITGPFRPALERAFAETFGPLRRRDPLAPLAVITPSRRLSDRVKEIALEALPEGFAAVRFFNLFSFAKALYDESVPPGFTFCADRLVPERLVEAILRRHFKEERYLSRAAIAPGAILGALHELKDAAVHPDHALALLIERELELDNPLKLAEILSLYKRYSEELRRRKLHVRADVVRRAADAAPRSAFLGGLAHVLYYGFYDLDQNQTDLFREVCRRVPATVFFPYEKRPEYAFARDFLKTVVAPLARSAREVRAEAPAPRLRQVAASGAHDEVWAAAKEILRLADAGIPCDEIGLVARTLDPYLGLVESIFAENRIPFTSSARRRLDRDPKVKAARLLFSLDGFPRGAVLDLLRSPSFRRSGGDPELWDQASRLMGIGHGADEWRRRLGACEGKDFVFTQGGRAEQRKFTLPRAEVDRFWGHVRALLEAPPPPPTWAAFAEWALERHRRFLEPDPRVEGAIASLAALEGLQMDDPLGLLVDRLGELSEPAGGRGGVRVLDAMAARGLPFRALLVLGMNERVFPRFILEDAFLRDAVRSRLDTRLGCRLPRKLAGYEEERLLFTLLLGASDEIVLSYQRSDEKGRLQIPSIFLPPAAELRQVPRRPAERLESEPLELLTPREASLRTGQGEAVGRALGWDVSMLVEAASFLRAVEARGPLTPFDGRVDTARYWPALAGHGISPTALEKLAECPFRYFASKMLDLEPLLEPEGEDEVLPVEIGQIYHDVLERFHREGDLERRLEEAFAGLEAQRSIRYPVLWDVRKERIRKVLRAFVDADDTTVFRPSAFEVEVRGELPVAVGGRKGVTFRGFLDRLDRGPGGAFRVVDYKRRRSSKYPWIMETGVFKKGMYLQPPLYFLLTAQSLGNADPARSKFVYLFVESVLDDEPWEMELDGADFWGRRDEFGALLARLVEAIPRGEFPIRPGDGCKGCDYRTMCRKSHRPTRLRAEGVLGS